MNCKPGDMACVVRTHVGGKQLAPGDLLGAVVKVATCEMFQGLPMWVLEKPLVWTSTEVMQAYDQRGRIRTLLPGQTRLVRGIHDAVLQPLRDSGTPITTPAPPVEALA